MDRGGGALIELYRESLRIGDQLLQCMQAPPNEQQLTQLEGLIAHRESVSQRTTALLLPGGSVGDADAILKEVVEQQRKLESVLGRLLREMQASATGTRAAEENLRDLQRLLKFGPRSCMLDERR